MKTEYIVTNQKLKHNVRNGLYLHNIYNIFIRRLLTKTKPSACSVSTHHTRFHSNTTQSHTFNTDKEISLLKFYEIVEYNW